MCVVAKEQAHSTQMRVLNYSPGPLDTSMQHDMRESATYYKPSQAFFKDLKANGTLLLPEQSSKVCLELITSGCFESGKHIDYYDEIEGRPTQ